MKRLFLLIGGNQGNREVILQQAELLLIQEFDKLQQKSAYYETEAWGFETELTFYNRVLEFYSDVPADKVLELCLATEHKLGRVRNQEQYSSRTIDIDILVYGNQIIQLPDLIIPHPRMHLRRFCLEPFCEIAPDLQHPEFGKTMHELLETCKDTGWVKKLF